MITDDDALTYPGEFEVLRTKAAMGMLGGYPGTFVLTNYRLRWTPGRFANVPKIAVDLENISSAEIGRSLKTFFVPVLRVRVMDGATYEWYSMQEDLHRVLHVVNDYRRRERYRPGKLFEENP